MATEKQISSRVRNKVDLEKNWKMAEGKFKPLDGEIIVY